MSKQNAQKLRLPKNKNYNCNKKYSRGRIVLGYLFVRIADSNQIFIVVDSPGLRLMG